jgi:hypothetical protein
VSARLRFDGDSLRRVKANIKAAGEKQVRILARSLEAWADDAVAEVQAEITDIGAIDQGILHAATTRTAAKKTGSVIRVTVFNPLEYATIVEFGRRPKQGLPPPLLPLVGWAGRKGIVTHLPRNIAFDGPYAKQWAASYAIWKALKKRSGSGKKSDKPLDPVIRDMLIIRAIAAKIYEKGIAGRHPFAKAFDRKAGSFAADIAAFARLLGA